MRFVLSLCAILASGLLAGAASAAAALDANCIWNAVPQAKRDAMLADYRGKGAASRLRPTDDDYRSVMRACSIAQVDETRTRSVVAGKFMWWVGEIVLKERHNADAARLDQAWNAVPIDQRRAIGQAAFQEATGQTSDTSMLVPAVTTFLDTAKLPDAAIADAVFYFIGRALVLQVAAGDAPVV